MNFAKYSIDGKTKQQKKEIKAFYVAILPALISRLLQENMEFIRAAMKFLNHAPITKAAKGIMNMGKILLGESSVKNLQTMYNEVIPLIVNLLKDIKAMK